MKKMLFNKARVFVLSFFAFMILGSVNATAQWVSPNEAEELVKTEIQTLENDFNQATTDAQRYDIALEKSYFTAVLNNLTHLGLEVPAAIESARIKSKPVVHSSGLVYLSAADENLKIEAQALVDQGIDLLSI